MSLSIKMLALMQLTPEQIRHIAKLARLKLTDAEVAKFTPQLGAIIGYVDHLSVLDTANVPETNQVTGLANVTREDVIQPFPKMEELIATSQNPIVDRQIKVRKSI